MRVVITMAEFCLDCFNRMNGTHYKEKQVWLDEYLCEGCAEWKPCVMQLYPKPIVYRIVNFARNNTKRDGKTC